MFAGVNVCVFETKPCLRGFISVVIAQVLIVRCMAFIYRWFLQQDRLYM